MAEHQAPGRMGVSGSRDACGSPSEKKGAAMLLTSECVLVYDPECKAWTATLPQYGNAATSGSTREEAVRNAMEVLAGEAADLMEEGRPAPRPSHMAEVVMVTANVTDEDFDEMRYMAQARAAETLEVAPSRITALIKAGVLDSKVFGSTRKVSIESVDRYRATPRKAGRPKAASRPA